MKIALSVFVATVALPGLSSGQPQLADLRISVQKQPYGETQAKPFPGVGVFYLMRGGSKLDGASCPDRSDKLGEVRCRIPCKSSSKEVMVVRVRPPSDQDALAGWITPSHQDVQVRGCTIDPSSLTMRYEDAKFALNRLLMSPYFADAAFGGGGGEGGGGGGSGSAQSSPWLSAGKNPAVASKVAAAAGTAEGRAAVAELYRIASEAARAPDLATGKLSPEEQKQYEALTKLQVLSKNALLSSKLRATLPPDALSGLKFEQTSDLAVYRDNLNAADKTLMQLPSKNAEQLKLSDDLKTLKALPATGKDAAAAADILRTWK